MNSQFKAKLIQYLAKNKKEKGFTLIELLVVVIIIGVLAAVALPNLLGQVSKGRQAEAKTNLGAINRAQQTYRLEKATFGEVGTASFPLKVSGQYYDFDNDTNGPTASYAGATATAKTAPNNYSDDILDYESAVTYNVGQVESIICEESVLNADDDTVTNASGVLSCADDAQEVK